MTIIEKMYAGEKLSEYELRCLINENDYGGIELGKYEVVEVIEGEHNRWTQDMDTIIKVGKDYWCIPWEAGLTENQDNEYYYQPYRVERRERVVTESYYVEV